MSAALPGPGWLRDRRLAAHERFAVSPLPTEQAEEWRYSRISDLDFELYSPLPPDPAPAVGVPAQLQRVLDTVGPLSGLVVIRNGRVAHVELDDAAARQGVKVGSTADVSPDTVVSSLAPEQGDALVHLHDAFVHDVAVVRVPAGVALTAPVVVLSWVDEAADKRALFPHLVVDAGAQSELTVVEYLASDDVAAFVDPITEISLGDGANVRHVWVQDLGRRVWHTGRLWTRAGRDATARSWLVSLGGDYARLELDVQLPGVGSTGEVQGVYFGDGTQVHDFRSAQVHVAPRGKSNFYLKGAVVDEARGVYSGVIKVERGAKGTDAFLTNRNLVLSEGARVDSVPNLEIVNENDLRNCGHAAATGPVDEEQLFYLESRGVPTEVAERLIVLGFFDDILARLPVPGLVDPLRRAVATKLEGIEPRG